MIKKIKKFGRKAEKILLTYKEQFRCNVNKYIKKELILKKNKLHIGCGDIHLNDFINVDFRATKATDITLDCISLNYFNPESMSLIYSNAFFEHVYRPQQLPCLKSCYRTLSNKGILLFTGIPNFEEITKAYLTKQKGIFSKTFDTFDVYRYTHGNPEQSPDWWLEQLHKAIFDVETAENLLISAGFTNYCIFTYQVTDTHIPTDLGFVAFKSKPKRIINHSWLSSLVSSVNKAVMVDTLTLQTVKLF